MGRLNRNQEALIILDLRLSVGLVESQLFEVVVGNIRILAVVGIVADLLLLSLQNFNQTIKLTLRFI